MERVVLYYLVALAGFVMVVGGMWLLWKERIYLDKESKQPISVKTPLGEFSSNYPALALFALGFFPLIYPIYTINSLTEYQKVETVTVHGIAKGPSDAIIVYATRAEDSAGTNGKFRFTLPFLERDETQYKLLMIANNQVLDRVHTSRRAGEKDTEINFRSVQFEAPSYRGEVVPIPEAFQ
jgi:hypothetical protein